MPETNHHDLGLTRRDLLDRLAAWGRGIDDPVCAELVAASTT